MSFIPRPQEIYKYFKGNLYQVTAVAEHTETREQMVIYQALYGDFKIYARPLDMFISRVDREKYPDAAQEFCFELQGPGAERQRAESEPGGCAGDRTETMAGGVESTARDIGKGVCAREASDSARTAVGAKDAADRVEKFAVADAGAAPGNPAVSQSGGTGEELDPLVLEFLDADSYEQRLNVLAGLHHRITDGMITTMAIACDIEIDDGDIEERYESLKTCLQTLERYECNRLR